MVTPQVFICYAHNDNENPDPSKRWLERLLTQLAPLQLGDKADIWSDKRIELGDNWNQEIENTLRQASVAVLLVSDSFLASKYIRNSELPVLLYRAKTEGVIILPIIVRQCAWKETIFKYPDPKTGPEELSLESIQVPTTKPLNSLPEYEQDEVLYRVAKRVSEIIKTPKVTPSKSETQTPVLRHFKSDKRLTGEEIKQLKEAILNAYPDEEDLKMTLSTYLDLRYDLIKQGNSYQVRVFHLITGYFEARNETLELVEALIKDRQKDHQLQAIREWYQ